MRSYYAYWNEREHRFMDPVLYDYTFPVNFPHIIIDAINIDDVKAKIRIINNKALGVDRFDFNKRRVLEENISNSIKRTYKKENTLLVLKIFQSMFEKTKEQIRKALQRNKIGLMNLKSS